MPMKREIAENIINSLECGVVPMDYVVTLPPLSRQL